MWTVMNWVLNTESSRKSLLSAYYTPGIIPTTLHEDGHLTLTARQEATAILALSHKPGN